jgi:glycosyltransferase involved in cell wall biosynthesis
MKKVLFISHEASRTGAPILLLNLLKWLKQNTKVEFDLLFLEGGELEEEFKKIATVFYWKAPIKIIGLKQQIYNKILGIKYDYLKEYYNNLFSIFQKKDYNTIYGNTVISSKILLQLNTILPNAAIILHIHELRIHTTDYSSDLQNLQILDVHYIAVSQITQNNLILNHNIYENKISLIYEYIDVNEISKFKRKVVEIGNKFQINGSGFVHVRKGYDIFIMIAKRAIQKYPEIPFYFKWIGELPVGLRPYIEIDIKEAGLSNFIEFTGSVINPFPYFAQSDLFLMTSREDPFPIVCLEHAALGIPIVCFENVSGIPEFIGNNAGIIIPYLDVEKTVDTLADLFSNREKRIFYGENARQKVNEYDINQQALKIFKIIENA